MEEGKANLPSLSPFTGLSDIIKRKKEDLTIKGCSKPKKPKKKTKKEVKAEEEASIETALDDIVDKYIQPEVKKATYDKKTKQDPDCSKNLPIPKKPKRRRKPKQHVGTMAIQVDEELSHQPSPKKRKKETPIKNEADRKRVALLTSYGKNEWLGPYLKDNHSFDLDPQKLRKLKGSKLEELLGDVEDVLSNKSNSALGDGVVRQAMYQLETIVDHKTRFKVQGTTDKCFQNDHWRFLLERVKMKHGIGFGKMDPVSELSLITFQTASLVHYNNVMSTPTTDLDMEVTLDPQ